MRCLATVLLASCVAWIAAASAAADEVVMAAQTYKDATVTGYAGGLLTFRAGDRTLRKHINDVQRISLEGASSFNQAEELLAQGNGGQAADRYDEAVKGTKVRWQQLLIAARRQQARSGGGGAETGAASRPASEPASTVKPIAAADAPAPPASMGDMADALADEPRDPRRSQKWSSMDKQEQAQAVETYETTLRKWRASHQYRGVKVAWTLTLDEVKSEGDQVVVKASSGEGYSASAQIKSVPDNVLKALKKGQTVRLTGTIKDYKCEVNTSESIFNADLTKLGVELDEVSIEPAHDGAATRKTR